MKIKNMKTHLLIAMLISVFSVATGQNPNRVISGQVSTLNDLPVANFLIEAKKSGAAVKTDSTGMFSIIVNPKDVLLFKGKVFRNEKVRINKNTPDSIQVKVDFIVTPRNKELAVGYGYVSEDNLINAVSQLERQEVDFCSYNDMFELIRGRFAGVQIRGNDIIIRGISSINLSSSALLVVDGNVVSSIAYMSPCDVTSINVIKDSGASIYGSRGANGVVVIETRKGND